MFYYTFKIEISGTHLKRILRIFEEPPPSIPGSLVTTVVLGFLVTLFLPIARRTVLFPLGKKRKLSISLRSLFPLSLHSTPSFGLLHFPESLQGLNPRFPDLRRTINDTSTRITILNLEETVRVHKSFQ